MAGKLVEIGFISLVKALREKKRPVTLENLEALTDAIEERKMMLEMQEPLSYGVTHENWQTKYDELGYIGDTVEKIKKMINKEETTRVINKEIRELQKDVDFYQSLYGGIARLKCLIE